MFFLAYLAGCNGCLLNSAKLCNCYIVVPRRRLGKTRTKQVSVKVERSLSTSVYSFTLHQRPPFAKIVRWLSNHTANRRRLPNFHLSRDHRLLFSFKPLYLAVPQQNMWATLQLRLPFANLWMTLNQSSTVEFCQLHVGHFRALSLIKQLSNWGSL